MHSINLPVLLGSSRIGRRSTHAAAYLLAKLTAMEHVRTQLLDLAEYNFPIMEERMLDMDPPPPGLAGFAAVLAGADGILIVAPEYKNGYPGVLKNALDYLPPNIFRRKPIGICTVSSGGFGGINCLAQLRLVCLAMGGVPTPLALTVSNVKECFDNDGAPLNPRLDARADEFLSELLWYTEALAGVTVR